MKNKFFVVEWLVEQCVTASKFLSFFFWSNCVANTVAAGGFTVITVGRIFAHSLMRLTFVLRIKKTVCPFTIPTPRLK